MILRNIFTLKKNRFFENLESKSPLKTFHPTVTKQRKRFFFHAILVIKRDESLNKSIKGFDVPTEQIILQQFICFFLNYSKKEATVQPLVRLP